MSDGPLKQPTNRRRFLASASCAAAAAALTPTGSASGESPSTAGGDDDQRPTPARPPSDSQERPAMDPKQFRQHLAECLGGPWPKPGALNVRLRETSQAKGFRIESLTYDAEPGDPVPALLLIPDGVSADRPAPAVAVWHQHAGQWHLGKSEPAGLAGNAMHHTGAALAREGYVVLCPDALCFEQRQDPTGKLKGGNFERFEFLRYVVDGKCMAWKNILDMRRAIDLLVSRAEVRADRIGCYGHSMGSTHTWLIGPWEPRIRCLVGNCCLPTYKAIHREHMLHCFPNFVPGIHQYGDTPEIAALIAPRPLHMNFGDRDGGSPIDEVRAGVERIAKAYAAAGAGDHFSHYIQADTGHVLSAEMWQRTKAWFARHLS